MSRPANPVTVPLADYTPTHFLLAVVDGVATVTLNRPERKNPLTFESYAELRDLFRALATDREVRAVVIDGRLEITRRSLGDQPKSVAVTTPSGTMRCISGTAFCTCSM